MGLEQTCLERVTVVYSNPAGNDMVCILVVVSQWSDE